MGKNFLNGYVKGYKDGCSLGRAALSRLHVELVDSFGHSSVTRRIQFFIERLEEAERNEA